MNTNVYICLAKLYINFKYILYSNKYVLFFFVSVCLWEEERQQPCEEKSYFDLEQSATWHDLYKYKEKIEL